MVPEQQYFPLLGSFFFLQAALNFKINAEKKYVNKCIYETNDAWTSVSQIYNMLFIGWGLFYVFFLIPVWFINYFKNMFPAFVYMLIYFLTNIFTQVDTRCIFELDGIKNDFIWAVVPWALWFIIYIVYGIQKFFFKDYERNSEHSERTSLV